MRASRRACIVLTLVTFMLTHTAEIRPGEDLLVDGIPKIPASLAANVAGYGESRSAGREIVSRRFGDTDQPHLVKFRGGGRTQLSSGDQTQNLR